MKVLIGIAGAEDGKLVCNLLKRLQFPDLDVEVVHVVESLQFPAGEVSSAPNDAVSLYHRECETMAKEIVKQSVAHLQEEGISASGKVLHGFVVARLTDYADEVNADLIAIAGKHESTLDAMFTGSVARGLAIESKQSILVVKGDFAEDGVVDAVIATDHSEYVNRCLDRFLAAPPKGLGTTTVLTAYDVHPNFWELLRMDQPQDDEWTKQTEAKLHEKNTDWCARLKEAGIACDTLVSRGKTTQVITQTMQETGAELLILGAQGHGFLQRLRLGSVSMHQTVGEEHSVLLLRS